MVKPNKIPVFKTILRGGKRIFVYKKVVLSYRIIMADFPCGNGADLNIGEPR
jgi:hypothetical protein